MHNSLLDRWVGLMQKIVRKIASPIMSVVKYEVNFVMGRNLSPW